MEGIDLREEQELLCEHEQGARGEAYDVTQIIDEDLFLYRQRDLVPFGPRRRKPDGPGKRESASASPEPKAGQKRKHRTPSPSLHLSQITMDPTQRATQPMGQTSSELSERDASDIICLLHPHTPAAFETIKAVMLNAPQHISPNDDLEGITEDDLDFNPELSLIKNNRVIALRMSSSVKISKSGFTFGRNKALSDILLVTDDTVKHVSNIHFRIYVNAQGSLMLEDCSMNGTIVDDDHLLAKSPRNPASRALQNGAIICVFGREKAEIKLMVRTVNRGDHQKKYEEKLRQYLKSRGTIAQFGSMRESQYGNHWSGGKEYNFTGLLGKGAFAMVYRVQTKVSGTILAAKELDKRRFIKNGILDIKFDNELKIMKQLNHPHIVQYEAYHEFENWIYIVMEYVPYGELSTDLRNNGPLSEPKVQTITRQVLHALKYLHRRNITHRDIKPDNILIASREPLIVKLSDFGLSKSVKNPETFLKTFCGTLLYCAPEIYPDYGTYTRGLAPKRRRAGEAVPRGSPYSQSVDMWSFGAVLFHLLADKAPIMGRGDDRGAQMLNNIMTKDRDFEPLRAKNVSEQAIDFISRLLNRNPMLRPTETECFQHPWLADVEDVIPCEENEEIPDIFSQDLAAVEEEDEDDWNEEEAAAYEAIFDLQDLTSKTRNAALKIEEPRPAKKPRTSNRNTGHQIHGHDQQDVIYPTLPQAIDLMRPPTSTAPAKLFGEITPSLLASSGVLGDNPAPATPGVPEIRHQVDQISVDDFMTMDTELTAQTGRDISDDPLQYPQTLGIPGMPGVPGSAASLYGAEAEIGQLNMASPVGGLSDAPTPDTTNPVTPRESDPSPGSARTKSISQQPGLNDAPLAPPKLMRQIDLNVLGDEAAYKASLEARQASRAQIRAKGETYQPVPSWKVRKTIHVDHAELAKTIDASTGREVSISYSQPPLRRGSVGATTTVGNSRIIDLTRTEILPSSQASSPGNFDKVGQRLGSLRTLPGSFLDMTIDLEARMTSWGRGVTCTVPYADKKDTRIPKYALKILFWAPGMETEIEKGKDWTELSGIRTIVSTSTTKCIWVNDVELRAESSSGTAALYGKIYTGDIITIWKGKGDGDAFLRFRVDIAFGESAGARPDTEAGFQILQERHYHGKVMKERESMKGDTMAATTMQ